jgi:CRP-like cAMP-binding protein
LCSRLLWSLICPPNRRPVFEPLLRKLQLWKQFDDAEQTALLALPHKVDKLAPSEYIVREGLETSHSCLLLSGFAFRQKVTVDGARSINSVHMRGDLVDLQNTLLGVADHSVQALTNSDVAYIPRAAIVELALTFPNIGMAMWYDTLVDASIFREWILNVARRDAKTRIAHLLCEFGVRLESLGLGDRLSYEFPMTQEQLADATGMTPVHVNRSLKELEERGLITRTARYVCVAEWEALARTGGFNDRYLHLSDRRGKYELPDAKSAETRVRLS